MASVAISEMSMPPAEDDDGHGKAENAKHRHVLQKRPHVVGREKSRQQNRERDEQHSEDDENDLLLSDANATCAHRAKHV